MIGRLRGPVVERGLEGAIIVDVGGVGYEVFVPLGALGRLPEPPAPVELHVHTHVREDALVLYGFPTAEDRAAFRAVMGVGGVGPKLALAVSSVLDAAALAQAVARQDRARFKGIPGVGKKTVERLILELPDKLPKVLPPAGTAPGRGPAAAAPAAAAEGPLGQVVGALVSMGYRPLEAERAVEQLAGREDEPVEVLLREALVSLA